jgi:hypothetical protein
MEFTLPRKGRLYLGGAFVVMALLMYLGAFCVWYEAYDAKTNWRAVSGRVTTSRYGEPRKQGRTIWAVIDVRYDYEVANRRYTQTRVSFRDIDQPVQEAIDTVARYHVGDLVTVRYNPENPEEAVIEFEQSDAREMFLAGCFFVLMPLLVYAREVKQLVWAKKLC